MTATEIYILESERSGRICLQFSWPGLPRTVEEWEAETAWERLVSLLEEEKTPTSMHIVLTGHYGQDFDVTAPSSPARPTVRRLYHLWYTQAVQAQAAIFLQRITPPKARSEKGR